MLRFAYSTNIEASTIRSIYRKLNFQLTIDKNAFSGFPSNDRSLYA